MVEEEMIAVVGMSCLLPGGISHYEEFWSLLVAASDQRSEVPFSRWNSSVYFKSESTDNDKTSGEQVSNSMIGMTNTNHAYFLPDEYLTDIDPSLFYLSPAEVPAIDPQQRLLLKLALSCLDDAAMPISKIKGSKTGVFIGVMNSDYSFNQSNRHLNINEFTSLGLSNSISSNRISYTFDLRGPSVTVDTACSSSSVCIHHAMNSLREKETDMCLAGGVNVILSPRVFVTLSQLNLLSPDGRCKAFDEKGDGYARGEGGGMFLLKRLSDAIRDKDRVHGLLVRSSVNQDGRSSIPITSPNVQSQIDLYKAAYKDFQINLNEIQYIEAHGTGTAKGDAVEINSIQSFFLNDQTNSSSQLLRIGSVKTNIGHLESGAGVIGIMKSILCLKHKKFVASLHFNNYPSSFVNIHPRLKVQTSVENWLPIEDKPRFCGVNSFGYGGTNAHVVVMEYINKQPNSSIINKNHSRLLPYILPISTKNKHFLATLMQDHASYLENNESIGDLSDYCYTLGCRKMQFNHRAAIIGTDRQSLIEQLKHISTDIIYTNQKFIFSEITTLTFLFGGQGSQCVGMGLNLMCMPAFADHMFKIDEWTRKTHNWSLLEALKENSFEIDDPNIWSVAQSTVAIFAIETSTAFLLANHGVHPSMLIGHSAGEFAAVYCSRLLDLNTLLSILWTLCTVSLDDSIFKAQIFEIRTSADDFEILRKKLSTQCGVLRVEIACINSPQSITVAGYYDHMEILKQHIAVFPFNSYSIPFHTSLMEVIESKAMQELEKIFQERKNSSMSEYFFPSIENVEPVHIVDTNGSVYLIDNHQTIDLPYFSSQYWWNIARTQVNFPNLLNIGINRMLEQNGTSILMLDLSPQPVLTTASLFFIEHMITNVEFQDYACDVLSVHSRYEDNALLKFSRVLAQLYTNGYSNETMWNSLYPTGGISDNRLPPISSQKNSYWSESLESIRSRMLPRCDKKLTNLLKKFQPISEANVTNRDRFSVCVYEGYIQVSTWSLIQEHIFQNSMLLPATYYFEIFFSLANTLLPTINYQIKNIQFQEAFWMDQSDQYYIKIEVKPKSLLSFDIHVSGCQLSKDSNETSPLKSYSTATLEYNNISPVKRQRQLYDDFIQSSEKNDSTKWYEAFRQGGFIYGESFSLVESVYSQSENGKALVHIRFPLFIKKQIEDNEYHLHPGIVDAATQGAAAVISSSIRSDSLPIECELIEIHKSLSSITDDQLWAEVFSRPNKKERVDSADVYLFSNAGDHIATFHNFTSKDVSHKQETFDYEKIISSIAEKSHIIFTEFIQVNNEDIEENNDMFPIIISDSQLKLNCELSMIIFNSSSSIQSLLADLQMYRRSLDIIIIIPEILDDSSIQSSELIYKNFLIISEWLLLVFQGVSQFQSISNRNLVRSLQIVSRCPSPKIESSIIYGCIVGYFRVWLQEKHTIKCRLIEIDMESNRSISEVFHSHIFKELKMNDLKIRCHVKLIPFQSQRFIANYSFANVESIIPSDRLFSSEKTYVLIGGCSTMGMYVTNWMVKLGAKHVILASRSGFNKKLKEKRMFELLQKNLSDEQAKIEIALLDITSSLDLQRFFQSHSNIGGILNMCMELRDSLIETHTNEHIQINSASKVLGSLLLHSILNKLNYKLDFIIMFSSTTSLFGNIGQFSYAGANAFMDSFASCLEHQTPYFSINLPPIADVGYLANNQNLQTSLEQRGWKSVSLVEVLQFLAKVISQIQSNDLNSEKNLGILKVNPITFIQSNPNIEYLSNWKNLLNNWLTSFPQLLTIIHQEEQENQIDSYHPGKISDKITHLIATSLGFSEDDQVSIETRLSDLGFHSMAAMELKSSITKLFRIDLPISFLLGTNTTIKQIQRQILDHVKEKNMSDLISLTNEKIPSPDDHLLRKISLDIPILLPFRSTSLILLNKQLEDMVRYFQTIDNETFPLILLKHISQWIENAENDKNNQSYQLLLSISNLDQQSVINEFSTRKFHSLSEYQIQTNPLVIFLFPGQGDQYSNMSAGLYRYNETYRQTIDSLCHLITSNNWLSKPKQFQDQQFDLRYLIFPFTAPLQIDSSINDQILSQTEYAQPAIFIISYALTQYLMKLGIQPSYCFGHSVGEYLAACISGVLTVADALNLLCHRAFFMSQCASGKMIAVKKNRLETEKLLNQFNSIRMKFEISVCNSEQQTVVGGSSEDIQLLKSWLKENAINCKELDTSHAYHTSTMRPAGHRLMSFLSESSIIFNRPKIPYMSNLTGQLITKEQAIDRNYYEDHMCKTVQASENIDNLIQLVKHHQSSTIFIEIGPGQTLTNLVKQRLHQEQFDSQQPVTVFNTLRSKSNSENCNLSDDINHFLISLTNIYNYGLSISLSPIYSDMYSNILNENFEMRLSFAQERIWFMEQIMPNHAALRTTSSFHISAEKQEILNYFSILINRHPILRVSIHRDKRGHPYHRLHHTIEWNLEEDLSLLEFAREGSLKYSSNWYEKLNMIFRSYSEKAFVLEQPPLFRLIYLPITEDRSEAILYSVFHHLLIDAYSGSVLTKEISLFLNNPNEEYFNNYQNSSITFFQHALYERLLIKTLHYQQRLDYWRNQLSMTEYYIIPTDQTSNTDNIGYRYSIEIDDNLLDHIRKFSSEFGITISSFLASVLTIVLSLYNNSNSSYISIGMTETSYSLSEAKNLVGYFVNLLIIRCQMEKNQSIKSVMLNIHDLILNALDHSYPFIELISQLKVKRDINFNSLFQVLYNFRQLTSSSNRKEFQLIAHDQHRLSQFDLELHVNSYDNKQLDIYMLASSQLNHLASFLAQTYSDILKQICQETNLATLLLSQLRILSNVQREYLMKIMNTTSDSDYVDQNKSNLVSLFNEIVDKYPNNLALYDPDKKLQFTYKQLSNYSTYFAQQIRELSPQSGKYIGVYLERDIFVPLSIWSILKCGNAYVPLDPKYFPPERLLKVIETTSIDLIITSNNLVEQLKQILKDKTIPILLCHSSIQPNYSIELFPVPQINQNTTAYLEFTSGSTGIPKGVQISHGNLVNLFENCLDMYLFNSQSICLGFHSFAFDLHAWEIFGTHFSGGCLIILHDARDVKQIFNLCKQSNVTHMSLTPSIFQYFLSVHQNETLPNLKCVMLCGEIFDYSVVDDWYQIYFNRNVLLVNAFGITETTVINSFRSITINDRHRNKSILPTSWIGRPMKKNYFIVLDDKQEFVPPFLPGELYIGGDCVSTEGYINSPLSNSSFCQFQFSKYEHVQRWYRTGDLVFYDTIRNDFAYLGRINQQIKLGAVRIEPQEIEYVLNQLDGIHRSAVVPVKINEDVQLIAYLEKDQSNISGHFYSPSKLRIQIQQSLPQIMIPSKFLFVPSFPLTNSGKIDRITLSKPETVQSYTKKMSREEKYPLINKYSQYNNDSNLIEDEKKPMGIFKDHFYYQLMNIFNTVLGHEVLPTSRFFEGEGGTSIQGIQLIYLINSTFNCSLAINILYLHSTIIELVDYLRSKNPIESSPLVQFTLNNQTNTSFSSTIPNKNQFSLIFIPPAEGESIQYMNIAQKLIQSHPNIDIYSLERLRKHDAIHAINLYCQILKKKFSKKKIAFIGFSLGGKIAFELAKRLVSDLDICFVNIIDSKLNDKNSNYTDAQLLSSLIDIIDRSSNTNNSHIQQYLFKSQSTPSAHLCQYVAKQLNIIPFNNPIHLLDFIKSFREDILLYDVLQPNYFPESIPVFFIAANEDSRKLADEWKVYAKIKLITLKSSHHLVLYDPLLIHHLSSIIQQYHHNEQLSIEDYQFIHFQNLLINTNYQLLSVKSNISQTMRMCTMILHETFLNTKVVNNTFDLLDNLDTGNSCAQPFQPIITAIQLAARDINKYRQYQPNSYLDNHIQNLILQFCKKINWLNNQQDLNVTIGSGTSQLWDCILRTIILEKGDVILIPSPTYGVFLPPIEISGGQIVFIPLRKENNYKLDSIQLSSVIFNTHKTLIHSWLKQLPYRLTHLLQIIDEEYLSIEIKDSNKKINDFIKSLQKAIENNQDENFGIYEYVENELLTFLCEILFNGNKQLFADIQSNGFKSKYCPNPPRIVGLLHINPSIFGTIYDQNDLIQIGKICEQRNIYIIEDFAYALLQLPSENQYYASIATFRQLTNQFPKLKTILLFSLSKAFAIADIRLGVLIGNKPFIDQINAILSTTSVFTPVLFQSAISTLFSCKYSTIIDYLAKNSRIYERKRNILLACLIGFNRFKSQNLMEQTEIDELKILLDQIIEKKKYDQNIIQLFFSLGLSEYFTICCVPTAGFFIIVDCQPFLQSIGCKFNIKSSFHMALFLAHFYRIRVIPEEMMGTNPEQTISPQLLRLSYSIDDENIIQAGLTILEGFYQLKSMEV